jgi:phosphoglycerate dehydrogenase-like enzyme
MAEEKKLKILSAISLTEPQVEKIKAVDPRIELHWYGRKDATRIPAELWREAEVLLTSGTLLPPPDQTPALKWIQFYFAGVEKAFQQEVFLRGGIQLTSASGTMVSQMGEYVMMALLMLGHKAPEMFRFQQQKVWHEHRIEKLEPIELRGSTVGIVGYGSIGREVARLLYSYGAKVLATKRDVLHPEDDGYVPEGLGDPKGNYFHRLYPNEALNAMLKECDFVVVSSPLTAETHQLISAEQFAVMKPGAFLLNVSRGPVVDTNALIEAARSGRLGGAVLDVFDEEPLPSDSPLWDAPNVVITPHIAGVSKRSMDALVDLFVTNLGRYLNGQELYNLIDPEQGY